MHTPLTSVRPGTGVFVGRDEELRRLSRMLATSRPRVLFVHGLAGSGKSALLQRFASSVPTTDRRLLVLDCREVEPTTSGFVEAVAGAAGRKAGRETSNPPLAWLGALAPRVVLCLDHYEVLRLLDTWLRQALAPALADNVSLLVAGREEPNPAWRRLPAGALEELQLGPLPPDDSANLVRALGVPTEEIAPITRVARGHPLALVLGALAAKESGPARSIRDVTLNRLLDEFTHAYLGDLDESTERLIEAAAVVRRLTAPLLEAMRPELDSADAVATLRELPFVDVSSDGLALHEALQQTVAGRLRALDPMRYRTLRQRAWEHLREQLHRAPRSDLWRHTADMIYLVENPAVREAHFPSGRHDFAIETATTADAAAIDAIVARHEPPGAAALLRAWWARRPEAFRVARDRRGDVAGFSIITTTGRTDLRRFARDPVVQLWLAHMHEHRLAPNQEALLIRRWLTWDAGDEPGEAQAAMWLDLKRLYMELRPRLRRNYGVTDHPEIYGPVMEQLFGGVIPGGAVEIDGRTYVGLYLEFGSASVDGWLTRLAATEFGLAEDDLLDVQQRQLVVGGHRVDLTPKEFEVLRYLCERTGDTVPRRDLLAAVWGYDDDLGSNVVDAVVCALRKKFGDRADLIHTVRGVGYRLSAS